MEASSERLQAELELLQAMYPDSVSYTPRSREVRYAHSSESSAESSEGVLVVRLPDEYPLQNIPEVILATGPRKRDLRSSAQKAFSDLGVPPGEEALDAFILAFDEMLSSQVSELDGVKTSPGKQPQSTSAAQYKTVIIWLHHLLNTNKRKLALQPSAISSASTISGITKPGYPGVLLFSGQRDQVIAHVTELRSQRWQAFQVRYDGEDSTVGNDARPWSFSHGEGIIEVGSMSELVQGIVGERERDLFLKSVGVK